MRISLRWMVAALVVASGISAPGANADEGIHAGVDLLFLSPKVSSVGTNNIFNYSNGAIVTADGSLDTELGFAQRVILGYEGDQGGGAQVRWFTFDNVIGYSGIEDHGGGLVALAGNTVLDIDSFDAELTQRGQFRSWEWLGTAGVRIGSLSLREDAINDINWEQFAEFSWVGRSGVEFNGAGPTVSVLGSRPVLWDGFSIFGGARTALLFGDLEQFRYSAGRWTNPNETVQVWEIQAGAEMEQEYDNFDLVLRVFWEAQRWDSDSNLLGDVGLHGFGVHTGIEY